MIVTKPGTWLVDWNKPLLAWSLVTIVSMFFGRMLQGACIVEQHFSRQPQETSWEFVTQLQELPPQGKKWHVIFPSRIELVLLDVVSVTQRTYQIAIDQAPLEFSFYFAGHCEATLHYSLQRQEKMICTAGSSLVSVFLETFDNQFDFLPHDLVKILATNKHSPYLRTLPMSGQLRALVEQLVDCPYQGVMQQLYLEAKTMEILVRHLWELTRAPQHKACCPLRPCERDQIHRAQDILLRDLAHPPSLDRLAKAVGLNPNKLNKGFRQEFGMTVFAWYRMTRIQRSRELLKQGQLNIDETAQALGFYDTSHFIRLFKQHFGQTPGMFVKTFYS